MASAASGPVGDAPLKIVSVDALNDKGAEDTLEHVSYGEPIDGGADALSRSSDDATAQCSQISPIRQAAARATIARASPSIIWPSCERQGRLVK